MKNGYGVFFQFDNGRTVCVAATDDHTTALTIYQKLNFYINAKATFGVGPDSAEDPHDRKLFAHFDRLTAKLGSERILRSGTGEILLFTKEV